MRRSEEFGPSHSPLRADAPRREAGVTNLRRHDTRLLQYFKKLCAGMFRQIDEDRSVTLQQFINEAAGKTYSFTAVLRTEGLKGLQQVETLRHMKRPALQEYSVNSFRLFQRFSKCIRRRGIKLKRGVAAFQK